jgi:hypothetical protein
MDWPAEELRRAREQGCFEDETGASARTERWAVVNTALRNPKGEVIGFSGHCDLTERRPVNAGAKRTSGCCGSVKDRIFLTDPCGMVLNWNAEGTRTGFRSTDAIGRNVSIFYTEEDVAAGNPGTPAGRRGVGYYEDVGWRLKSPGDTRLWADVTIPRCAIVSKLRGSRQYHPRRDRAAPSARLETEASASTNSLGDGTRVAQSTRTHRQRCPHPGKSATSRRSHRAPG